MNAPTRSTVLLRAGVGTALTFFPAWVVGAAEGHRGGRLARVLIRVLGVRQLTQAALTVTSPQLLTPSRGALVDGLHTASAVLFAAKSPQHRRAALINAALAATFCGFGIAHARDQRAVQVEAAQQVPATPQQQTGCAPEIHHGVVPVDAVSDDAGQFSLGLGDDSGLERAKLIAGALSLASLVAMLITSLFRAPSLGSTVLLAVATAGLGVAMSVGMARRRADRRLRIGP